MNVKAIGADNVHELLTTDPATVLVCAYDKDEEFRTNDLEGATSLSEFHDEGAIKQAQECRPFLKAFLGISDLFLFVLTIYPVLLSVLGRCPPDALIVAAVFVGFGILVVLYVGELVILGWIVDCTRSWR
jgi:hypothetical protein